MKNDVKKFEEYYSANFKRTSSLLSGLTIMIFDAAVLLLCIGIGFFLVNLANKSFIRFRSFIDYYIYIPAILAVFYAADLYPGIMNSPADDVKRLSICTFFGFCGIALSIFVEDAEDKVAIAAALVVAVPFATILLPGVREGVRRFFGLFKFWGLPAVVYCSGKSGNVLIDRFLKNPSLGYRPALIVNDSIKANGKAADNYKGIPVLPPSDELFEAIKKKRIKVAVLADYKSEVDQIKKFYRYAIVVSDQLNTMMSGAPHLRDIAGIVAFSSTNYLTKIQSLVAKRAFDIAIIICSLPLTLPLCLLTALFVKLTSPGPVLYGHKRVGLNGKEFKCWKFRSMYIDADKQLAKILAENPEMKKQWEKDRKLENDPRVTPFGKFIRKTSLDEFPQFINIFIGQMSFVGPRPVMQDELERYGKKADYILSVLPGLSGMWQTSGRSDTAYEDRVTLDAYYIQNWSIWLDIWILIKTVWVVLAGKGAY